MLCATVKQTTLGPKTIVSTIFVSTYCENELLHTVGGHAVEVGEMQLQVNLVAQDVLAQWAADHRLHGML